MTDSKRTAHSSALLASGTVKSLRYQPTPPIIEAGESSPRFHTLGTFTRAQPAVPRLRFQPLRIPRLPGSRRNSQVPSIRYRPDGPSW